MSKPADFTGLFGRGLRTLQMHVALPEGQGLQRVGLAYLARQEVFLAPFVINRGVDDLVEVIARAMTDACRRYPDVPLSYTLSGDVREVQALRSRLPKALEKAGRSGTREGRRPLPGVAALARHTMDVNNNWKADSDRTVYHLYLSTAGDGEFCNTTILMASERRVRFTTVPSKFYDPLAATFDALWREIKTAPDFACIPVWTDSTGLRKALNKAGFEASDESETTLMRLSALKQQKDVELVPLEKCQPLYARMTMALSGEARLRDMFGDAALQGDGPIAVAR